MKVRILFNRKSWPIGLEINAIKEWFPIDLDFEINEIDIEPEWMSNNKYLKPAFIRRLVKEGDDIVVLNLPESDWLPTELLGYAKRTPVNGVKFIAMVSTQYAKRNRNHGWRNNDEFAGRLRHELTHTFYQLSDTEDQLHEFEYEEKKIEKTLEDIKWENIPNVKLKQDSMKKTHINIHHTAIPAISDKSLQFDLVDRSHKKRFGEEVKSLYGKYVGYHYLIERNGVVQQARKDTEIGAHNNTAEMNYKAIGIAFAGHMGEQELTTEQVKSGVKLVKELQKKHDIPDKNVLPHSHFKPTECPGKNTDTFFAALMKEEPAWIAETTRPYAETILKDVDGFVEKVGPGAWYIIELVRKAVTKDE